MNTILPVVFVIMVCGLSGSHGIFNDDQKKEILANHDTIRSEIANGKAPGGQPPAANMIAMVWNDELAATAQVWADKCDGDYHDEQKDRKGNSGFLYVGQNMMPCHHSQGDCIKRAMTAFKDEATGYSFDTEACNGHATCLHYTQLAWSKSRFVGCGYNKCEGGKSQRLVCNYGPAGNVDGEKAYVKGKACSKCYVGLAYCLRGLCLSKKDCDRSDKKAECVCSINKSVCESNGGSYSEADCKCTCSSDKAGLHCDSECKDIMDTNSCQHYKSYQFCAPESPYHDFMSGNCAKTCELCNSIPQGEENGNIPVNVQNEK